MQFFQSFRKVQRFLSILLTGLLIFVSIEAGGLIRVASASTGTWTLAASTNTSEDIYGVTYGNSVFMGVGSNGMSATSGDGGVNWSPATTPSTCTDFLDVLYSGTKWYSACDDGNIYTSSNNGASWSGVTSGFGLQQVSHLATDGTDMVAVGGNETVGISVNGGSWSAQTISSDGYTLNGVAYGVVTSYGGTFVAVGDNGSIYMARSNDVNTWTQETSPVNYNLLKVTFANNQFVAVGVAGTILTSSDGVHWTSRTSGTNLDLYGVAYGDGKIVVVGDQGTILSSTGDASTFGITWSPETSNTSSMLLNVAYAAGKFVAVGAGGTVVYEQAASTNASLSGLSLSAGILSPTFASTITSYTASVANSQTSINVTPTLADSTTSVTVNGQTVSNGQAQSVSLNVGTNTINVVVTAQDGTTTKTYTITVTRAASSDDNLSALSLSSGTLSPSFDPATLSYTASVPYAVTSVNVQPTVEDGTATVKVNNQAVTSGQSTPVSLSVGSANTITVVVTAADGSQQTYTVTVTRQAASTNANLGNLALSAGTLSPTFASGTYAYTDDVDNATTSIDVTPTVADSTATVTVNGATVTSGHAQTVSLNTGDNTITVVVTAQDGTTHETYTVTVTRAKSSNNNLQNLVLNQGTLSPSFDPATVSYTVSVPYTVTSMNFTPTVADTTASVTVDGNPATSGQAALVSLGVGTNTIDVVVTAEDGTPKTYTVTVTREAASTNANLGNLALSAGTLSPTFASGTYAYTDDVDNATTSIDVTPTVADGTATVTVNGHAVTSGHAQTVSLNTGDNTITVVVTAQDGTTHETYTVTVNRAKSSNNNLQNLVLDQGTLSPSFDPATVSYTVSVPYTVTSMSFTPTVADSTASVTVDGNPATSGQAASVSLSVGANPIDVVVTAEDGTTKTYTVTVTRQAASTNANLGNLALSAGTLSPTFASGTYAYTDDVDNATTSIDVTPTVADGTATVTVNGHAVTSGHAQTVSLNTGDNTITVVVTAQDGTTHETYTVTVNRAKSSNADLSNLALSSGTLTPGFAMGTSDYSASVGNTTSSVDVTPTVADSNATVSVNGTAVTSGNSVPVPLTVGSNTITVVVTAQDGTTQKTYTITVNRAKSSNNNLLDLALNPGTLNPSFDSATTTGYTASVAYPVNSVTVTPTVSDPTATVTVNGNAVTSGQASTVDLNVGSNTINVIVTAQDGTTKMYTVTVTRQAASTNADLNDLTLSAGTLTPGFATDTLDYTTAVDYTTNHVDVTPTVADSTATLTVNGHAVTSGQATGDDLNVGSNTITVVVTAQDGTTQKTYTITINRTAPSTNATLSGLSLNHGTLSPTFDPGTMSYSSAEANAISSIDVTVTLADSTATLQVNGSTVTSGNAVTVPLTVGSNTITVEVTAQDGVTKQTYTLVVTRLGAGGGGGSTPPGNPGDGKGHVGDGGSHGNGGGNDTITKQIGEHLSMTAVLYSADGQPVNLPNIQIDEKGNFSLDNITPGTYQMVIYVTAPNGEKLAGQKATLTVNSSGQASVNSQLIDPFGTVTDALTHQALDGVKVSLYWADTDLNRSNGRTPNTLVTLPELINMLPNQNHNSQVTVNGGKYGWMVFPQGDYYIVAEKDGYETYDSRQDMRDETQGDTSYIRNGIIHVGQTVVQMNFNMQPKMTEQGTHDPYMFGYEDGTFKPNQSLTRGELAAILARIIPAAAGEKTTSPFHDVPASYWGAKEIGEIYNLNLMVGYPDGKFHPELPVTRALMAMILMKWQQLPNVHGVGFPDVVGHWAEDAILRAEAAGYVSGYPDGNYHPDDALTRAQAVVIFNKVLGRTPLQVPSSAKWPDVPSTFWAYAAIMEASVSHSYEKFSDGSESWVQ